MGLNRKQFAFSVFISRFILDLNKMGYTVALGEAYRPKETAKIYASQGKGIANSTHEMRLALDIMLFKNDVYLTKTEDYEQAGLFWEAQSTDEYKCVWGGRFQSRPDGNHFSFYHNGVS